MLIGTICAPAVPVTRLSHLDGEKAARSSPAKAARETGTIARSAPFP